MLTGILLLGPEKLLDLLANFTVWDLDIILGSAIVGHERQEAVISDIELPKLSASACLPPQWELTSWYSLRVTWGTSML